MNEREQKAFRKGEIAAKMGRDDNPYTHATSIQSANFWTWKRGHDAAPEGYHRLPNGHLCKCMKCWKAEDGSFWCCLPKPAWGEAR